MKKKLCPSCKGKGYVREKANPFLGVITLGMTALMQWGKWERCHICLGDGLVEEYSD